MPADPASFGSVIVDDDREPKIAATWMAIRQGAGGTKTGSGAGAYNARDAASGAAQAAAPLVTGTVIGDWDPALAALLAGDGF